MLGSGRAYRQLWSSWVRSSELWNKGWIANEISRKCSIVVAVVIFVIGFVLQTAAVDYVMSTTARQMGDQHWHAVDGGSSVYLRSQPAGG